MELIGLLKDTERVYLTESLTALFKIENERDLEEFKKEAIWVYTSNFEGVDIYCEVLETSFLV